MKNINIFLIIFVGFICISLLSADSSTIKLTSEANPQTQPQAKPNNSSGWQIYEINYSKTPPRRTNTGTVFDGELFHVFSGTNNCKKRALRDLWTYDPKTDKWNEKQLPNYVTPRLDAKMFATDNKILIYGGYNTVNKKEINYCNGYTYNPDGGIISWDKISTLNAPGSRSGYSTIWTGKEMIIFGGISNSDGIFHDCYAYSHGLNMWRKIDVPDGVYGRYGHSAIWTGKYMLITGGIAYHQIVMQSRSEYVAEKSENGFPSGHYKHYEVPVEYPVTCDQAALYNPYNDKWELYNMKDSRAGHTSVWTGKDAILWGGYSAHGETKTWLHDTEIISIAKGMSMSSSTRKKSVIPARTSHIARWTGHEMFIGFGDETGGDGESRFFRSGGIYDPESDKWIVPRNCPFTIFENSYRQLTFQNGNSIYNFCAYENNLTGKYLVDKDIFLPILGSEFQPRISDLELIDTPEGLFASKICEYPSNRIMTYAYWKFNENSGRFHRIDEGRKDIQYGQQNMLFRNKKLYSITFRQDYDLLSGKQGLVSLFNPKTNKWIETQTGGNIPVDRRLSAKAIGEDSFFLFSGLHESELQYSEVADVDWEDRLPKRDLKLCQWYPPWFAEQRRIARQSKTYPILRDGYIYNFKQNKWKRISLKEAPCPRMEALCCEFNGKFAVFGGKKRNDEGLSFRLEKERYLDRLEDIALFDGGIYDPKTNKWEYVRNLNTQTIPYSEDMYKELKLSSIGDKLLLYGAIDCFASTDENEGEFFGFIYDSEIRRWKKIEKPEESATEILEVLNIKDKTMLKIEIEDPNKEYYYYSEWFLYDLEKGEWTECSLNSNINKDFEGLLNIQNFKDAKRNTRMRKFKDQIYFYTYTPIDRDEKSLEMSNPRSTLRIYSYDPSINTTKECSNIELNIASVSDGSASMYNYDLHIEYKQFNTAYSRDRFVLYGLNYNDKYSESQPEYLSRLYVLIYNFDEK